MTRSRHCRAFVAHSALILAPACHLFQAPPSEPAPRVAEPEPIVLPPLETSESEPSAAPAASEPEPPGITPSGGPTRGTLRKAEVDAEMQRAMPTFRACYERALAARPALHGTLFVHFVVAPDGSVPYAAPLDAQTDLDADDVIECVLGELQKLRFPEPRGGRAVVSYPLKFEPEPLKN